jgi:3-oxoacid CoA-transferase B subunit
MRERVMPVKPRLTREQVAQRAALELPDGAYVNLGWGIPSLIADYLPNEITVYFHSENGILGMGRRAKPGEEDFDQVDAMKVPVTLIPGASFFHQADAHLMSRGGHLDVAVLGGFQVSEKGDLSNWKIPGAKGSGGIGGAMDIAAGAKTLIVCMEHTTKEGAPKNCEGVRLSADRSGMRGYHRYGSGGDRREAGRIDPARSGARLDGGGSAGIDRRTIDRAAANSGDEFRLI